MLIKVGDCDAMSGSLDRDDDPKNKMVRDVRSSPIGALRVPPMAGQRDGSFDFLLFN